MTNPVGTEAKRKELRELKAHASSGDSFPRRFSSNCQYWSAANKALPAALDGLDIAEEAMRALAVMKALSELGPEEPADIPQWRYIAELFLDTALAEWDKWEGS